MARQPHEGQPRRREHREVYSTLLGFTPEGRAITDDHREVSSALGQVGWGYSDKKLRVGMPSTVEIIQAPPAEEAELPSRAPAVSAISQPLSERGRTAAVRRNAALAEKRAKASEALKAKKKDRKREEYSRAGKGPLAPVTVLVQKTLKREGRKVVKAIQEPRFVMVEVPNKAQAEKGRRLIEHLAKEDKSDLGRKGGSNFDDDGPQPDTDQRVWDGEDQTDTDQGVTEGEILAEGDLVEGEEIDPFAYGESLRSAGVTALFDSSLTPDEIAKMTEDYSDYASTHEQFS